MKVIVDNCNVADWTTQGASAHRLNDWPNYIAGDNKTSLVLTLLPGAEIKKMFAIDVKEMSDFTFHYCILSGRGEVELSLNDGVLKYRLPEHRQFDDITFGIEELQQLTGISFRNNGSEPVQLIVSYIVASVDEIPLDLYVAVKEQLPELRYPIGTMMGRAGSDSIKLQAASANYISAGGKFSVIEIVEGEKRERHQLQTSDISHLQFTSRYNGNRLKNDYTNAEVFLVVPAEYGKHKQAISQPGINISGMESSILPIGERPDIEKFNWSTETEDRRKIGNYVKFTINIDCVALADEHLADMSNQVRAFIGRRYAWCNGKKLTIFGNEQPTYAEPTTEGDVSCIRYTFYFQFKEEVWQKQTTKRKNQVALLVKQKE